MPHENPSSPAQRQAGNPPAHLQTEEDYVAALREIEQYFREEPGPGTPEAARFDRLAGQISLYESAHWPISASDTDT